MGATTLFDSISHSWIKLGFFLVGRNYIKAKPKCKLIRIKNQGTVRMAIKAWPHEWAQAIRMHYKKNRLLRRVRSAAKGTFDHGRCYSGEPSRQCCYRSIAAVAKSVTIDLPFSGAFGLLRWAKSRLYMRLPFGSCGHLAVVNKCRYRVSCTTYPTYLLAAGDKRHYRSSIISEF